MLHRSKVFNNRVAIEAFLKLYLKLHLETVMEAATNYYGMYGDLKRLGISVRLVHLRKTRAIADAKIKNGPMKSECSA